MRKQILLQPCLAFVFTLGAGVFGLTSAAQAQQLELPRPSPLAKVSQVVGLTEVAVEYSSPAVKGRKIVGGVLPAGQLWRTGANGPTKITFSKDVVFEGSPVPAGTYSLFSIPGQTSWTVILNKDTEHGGTQQYKQELDQVRVQVKPVPSPHRERLTFLFTDTTESTTTLGVEWEKLRLPIAIKAGTDAQVAAGIKGLEDNSWRPYNNAARYLLESKKDLDHAMQLVEHSLSIHEDWLNDWTKAQLLAARGKSADACTFAQKAKALGDKLPQGAFFFGDDVKKGLADWKCAGH